MPHRRRSMAALALLLALVPALAACGGSTGTTKATPLPTIQEPSPVAAATGVKVPGTGYSFQVPRRWRDVTKRVSKDKVDAAAAAATAASGFTSNINVVIADDSFTLAQVEQITERTRARVDHDATSFRAEQPTRVAGALAGHLSGMHRSDKASYWLEQYLISHGKHTYFVTFSYSPKVPEAKRDKQIASVLASWTWAESAGLASNPRLVGR